LEPNVIENIVKNDLCIGCGICAAMCPQKALVMKFNEYGEYNPVLEGNCSNKCDLCISVCPFNDGNKNETVLGTELYESISEIKYRFETGYYLDSYVGYSNEFRQTSASGGMATWFLTTLLQKDIVDHVICVTPNNDPEKLFKFEIFDDADSVLNSSSSAYYPVEMSQVIQRILNDPGRYAIIGLPCFLKGLRLASQKNKKLREMITVTVGLVCGQTKSKHYTTYLSTLANAGGKLQKVNFRGKDPDKPANNFYFNCVNDTGSKGKIFLNEGVSEAWVNRWFTPNACSYCDDVFAELADVVFMDAWLPEYSNDSRGTSLVLVRSAFVNNIFSDGIGSNQINADNIPINKIVQSQAGVIDLKRTQLSYRLYLAKKNGLKIPLKRVKATYTIRIFARREVEIKHDMQWLSKKCFNLNYQCNSFNIISFKNKMQPYLKKIKLQQLVKFAYNLPSLVMKKMKK
jgi:coenzyme F420-reducing hydrogenase beta subunit